jgi:predicted permease
MPFLTTLRSAARAWWQTPGQAFIIALILALGIGATTTVFTLAYSVLIRPFPFPEPEQLVWITTYDTRTVDDGAVVLNTNRMPVFAHWVQHLSSVEQIAAWNAATRPDTYTVTGAGMPERVSGLRVTQQLFPMLGGRAALGSLFREGDDRPNATQAVVLSHAYWQRRFAGRPDIVGRSLTIENVPHVVVGIVADDFPLSGSVFAGAPIEVYLPLTIEPDEDIGGYMAVLARLRPGVSIQQARTELATAQRAMAVGRWQWMSVLAQRVTPLPELITRESRSPLVLLLAGVGCMLLMACANLANLLLVRAGGRRREMQVRVALGASMGHVFRQALAESAVVALAGGVAGVALAAAMTTIVKNSTWVSLARAGELQLDGTALGFAVALCAVTTVVFGSLPLLHLRRDDAMQALRAQAGMSPDRRAARVQRLALAAQVAFALILTAAGGLLLRSLATLLDVDPGFRTRGVVAMRVDPAGRVPGAERIGFFSRVLGETSAVPGVESAALTINLPMDRGMGWDALTPGQPQDPVRDSAAGHIVSTGYFRTTGIGVLAGRDFNSGDLRGNTFVMAINDTFARRLRAEGRDPLASRFLVLGNERQVVAVVSDVRHQGLDRDAGQEVYIPFTQAPSFFQSYDLVVRAADPIALVPALRQAIWRVDRNQAIGTPIELQQLVDRTVGPRRLVTWVVGGFAAAALMLAGLGVYGVVTYRIAQRRKELALRVALGAPGWRVTSTALADSLASVAIGVVAGVPVALGAGTAVRAYLFGVDAQDPATLGTACTVVFAAAIVAAYLPARRAPRLDPIAALRAE